MPFLTTAAIVGGSIAAAGAVGGAAISAHAAGKAAKAQSDAAKSAAQLQHEDQQASLDFQKQQYATNQANQAPFLKAGQTAVGELSGLTNTPGQGLLTPFSEQFQAPTSVTEQNDPGYQFRLDQGMKALNNSAAAKGGLLSGNTLQGAQNYAQNYASGEYGNVYNRSMQEYQNRFNVFNANQTNEYNRLAGLSGAGQTSANMLGQEGQAAANNIGNINLTAGQQQGQQLNNAAAATASGYVGGANAWANGLGGATNNIGQYLMLQQLLGGGLGPTTGGV